MSYYLCSSCGHRDEIFGHGGARAAAEKLGFPFLGEIPLDIHVREQSDSGKPVALDGSTPYGKAFQDVASAVAKQVGERASKADDAISIE